MKGILSVALVATLFFTSSCNKSDRDLDSSTGSCESAWTSMNHFHNIMREIHRVAQVDSVLNGVSPTDAIAPTICMDSISRTPDSGPFPITLKIYYSEDNVCTDQSNRSGVIQATFDGPYSVLGTNIEISLDEYSSDNVAISGNISMTVTEVSTDTLIFDANIIDGSLLDLDKSGKNQSYFQGNLFFTNFSGRKTTPTTDDDFRIEGTGSGLAENGVIYAYKIENEMILKAGCEYEEFGSFRLSAPHSQDRIANVNEGDGCDNIFQVAIPPGNGNQVVEIK